MDAKNLESAINCCNQYINIDSDREDNGKIFACLRNALKKGLDKDEVFNKLFAGWQLEGSYGDNLKITRADEYDMVFLLKFPNYELLVWEESRLNPGFVTINVEDLLNSLETDKRHEIICTRLREWSTSRYNLKVSSMQSWLQGLFSKTLNGLNYTLVVDDITYKLTYSRSGPAHTLTISLYNNRVFSVDFVPGIKLKLEDDPFKLYTYEAIPKPSKTATVDYDLFRQSYFLRENTLILNKQALKNALRMMKKFRDSHQNMANLKSYHIKTMFLWRVKEVDVHYWRKPLCNILIDMFTKLESCLQKSNLEFFWNRNCNLFKDYSSVQIHEMLRCVTKTRASLVDQRFRLYDPNLVYSIFLTRSEIEDLNGSIQDNQARSELEVVENNTPWLIAGVVGAAAAIIGVCSYIGSQRRNNTN